MVSVSIVGGSGYSGGELLRLLLEHPEVELRQVTSERFAGKPVTRVHPNLRKRTNLKFSAIDDLSPCDVIFLCLPHGNAMNNLDRYAGLAARLIDLSGDFRLNDAGIFEKWYKTPHACPERLGEFVYGIPEINRDRIATTRLVTGAGCNATATILALRPLFRRGLATRAVVEVKAGSSEGGNSASDHIYIERGEQANSQLCSRKQHTYV